jgi:hypothetical protein
MVGYFQVKTGAFMKRHGIPLAGGLLLAAALSFAQPAQASNKVSSPDIEKGQLEFEYRGGYDWDDTAKKDHQEVDKFIVNYGVTDRLRPELKLVAGGPDDDLDWTTLEASLRYQVFKDKEAWAKFSIEEAYKVALQEGKPDILEEKLLAQKDFGKWVHTLNVQFDNEVGDNAAGGVDINLGWKTKYKLEPYFEPGVEFYPDFGKMSGTNVKKYQMGPIINGKIPDTGFKYDVGYLFGMNKNVPDGRLKLILTYAFKPFGEGH